MATKTWTGALSTDWNDPGNWSPSGVPGSGDDVVIGTTTNSPTLSASTTVNTININGSDTLTLGGSLTVLTVTNGVTLSSTGGISGTGVVAATVAASGAAHITASGGQLEVTGAITNPGAALGLTIGGASDTLLLDAASAAQTVDLNGGTLELNSGAALTVGTTLAIGSGTLKLDSNTSTLTDAGGVTLSTGKITGAGKVAAAVTASGAAQITASGGTLEVTGAISGGAVALSVVGSFTDRLLLDQTSAVQTVTFGSTGTVQLGPGVTLTVGTAMAIGSGRLTLQYIDSTLNVAGGVTLSGGQISGIGTVNANLSGTGSVIANGTGTLHLTGTVASGVGLGISPYNGSAVLSIENTAISAFPMTLNQGGQTLAIGPSGNLTINGGNQTISTTVTIAAGGQLSDGAGFTMGGFEPLIVGAGKVTGAISSNNAYGGIVEASGGTLELVSALPASVGVTFEIANSGLAALLLDGAPGTGNTFTFLGGNGHLALANDTGFDGTISGLNVGTGGAKTNFVDILGHTVTISSFSGQGTTSGTITLSDGAVLHLTNLSSSTWYARTISDGSGGTDVFVSDSPFQSAASGLTTFSYSKGWTSQDQYPRALGDVNGDGKADIIGFGYNGAWVSLATGGGSFAAPIKELGSFSYTAGWTSQDQYPRAVADVNGDGKADIVGFGYGGVYVSLATGGGNFAAPVEELGSFSYTAGWTSDNQYPRELADVNGDGLADIVGFGYGGVWVSLATGGGGFAAPTNELGTFSYAAGWTSQDKYPRFLADVNGDGLADIVGFGYGGVYVSLATGGGHFAPAIKTLGTFSYANGWTSQDQYPRELADVNGDGMADIVGFGSQGVWVAHGKSDGTFGTPTFDFNDFGFSAAAGGWTSENTYPRLVGDVTGDGKADLVGFGNAGVSVAVSTDSATAAASATPSTSDAITAELNDVYQQILGRDPDMSGLATYSAELKDGTSLAALRETIANSPEAQGDLRQIYQDVLARDADDGGLTTYTAELASGTSLAEIRGIIAHSPEAQSDLATLFQAVLGRAAGAAELVGMEDQLGGGTSQAALSSTLADTGSAGGYTSLTATAADATLTAEAKTPTLFVFGDIAFGNDTVAGFDPTRDTIQLSHALVADLATLQSETTSLGDGSLITLNAGQSILISGVAPRDLGTANFRIV